MPHDADDRRALFQRVVDDIVDQIRTGKLAPGDVLPTARRMADTYSVASMTAQRALRELQHRGLTYAVVGKGTFIHPQAPERIGTDADGRPIAATTQTPVISDSPALNRRLALYLLERDRISGKIVDAFMNKDTAAAWQATEELATLQQAHTDLADDLAAYEANLGRAAASETPAPAGPPTSTKQRRDPKA
ncbi:GntR family transcriptional regulator [Micromonospora thermarum]|uniref:GntR family transcriptional regulator n=1 Tax=Micromonospora thermarum TaxID=2720024 RepID=A0ABX0ZGW3_9ACTN|nr:GntR family transcriptional regulator [Micromonospora thermarum]NJP35271.1 GntR family transcriptional regulator [Micromonospora thermarum]